jgi:hypothetical protein
MRIIEKSDNVIKLRGFDENLSYLLILLMVCIPLLFLIFGFGLVLPSQVVIDFIKNQPSFFYSAIIFLILIFLYIIFKISIVVININKQEINYSKKSLISSDKRIISCKDVSKIIRRIIPTGESYYIKTFFLLRDGEEFSIDFNGFFAIESANILSTFLGVPIEEEKIDK